MQVAICKHVGKRVQQIWLIWEDFVSHFKKENNTEGPIGYIKNYKSENFALRVQAVVKGHLNSELIHKDIDFPK